MNNTNDGLYEILTGKGDSNENRGEVYRWDNSTSLDYWASEYCNMINGTDGTIYPTDISKKEKLFIFSTEVCRSVFLVPGKLQTFKGVDTTEYTAPAEVFRVDYEDNVCYCQDGNYTNCLGDGLLDTSLCYSKCILRDPEPK